MGRKAKGVAAFCVVLLLGLAFSFYASPEDFVDVAFGSALPWWPGFPDVGVTGNETVTWDFHVVAGYNTTSPPIIPASPSNPNWNFTVVDGGMVTGHGGSGPGPVVGGFDYGTLTEYSGKGYLSGWGWVELDITNNLAYDVVVTNLTAEVTAGTETEQWVSEEIYICWDDPGAYNLTSPDLCEYAARIGNFSLVHYQFFDAYIDEVNYYTGDTAVVHDGQYLHDTRVMDFGQINPWTMQPAGSATLLGPDRNGDAAATGHVAPILLRSGETFNEYFGPGIFGNVSTTTQINGRTTLTLTYRPVRTPSPLDVTDTAIYCNCGIFDTRCSRIIDVSNLTEAYNTWTVDVNITVKNWDSVPMDINVSLYGPVRHWGNITHWSGSNYEQIGPTQLINLASMTETTLTWTWDLGNAPSPTGVGIGPWNASVRAIAVSQDGLYYDELWGEIDIILWGDINANGGVDLGDLGKSILIYSCVIKEPEWMILRADNNGDCKIGLGDICYVICLLSCSCW